MHALHITKQNVCPRDTMLLNVKSRRGKEDYIKLCVHSTVLILRKTEEIDMKLYPPVKDAGGSFGPFPALPTWPREQYIVVTHAGL